MLKRIGILVVVLVLLLAMIVFTSGNPGTVEIDYIFGSASTSIPLAFTIVFVAGWCFGLLSVSVYVLKLVNERRRLHKALSLSESEVSSLRNLPLQDAD